MSTKFGGWGRKFEHTYNGVLLATLKNTIVPFQDNTTDNLVQSVEELRKFKIM